jgi:drug/metabolite transporter (DMT)-like permease
MSVSGRRHLPLDLGVVTAILSAAAFGTSGVFATSLLRAGWTPAAAVAARLVIAAMALCGPAMRQLRTRPGVLRRGWKTVVFYGLVPIAGCQFCYFEAVQHLSVAVALLLEYSGTLLVVGWMWARHDQRPSRITAAGAFVAVAGLVLVLDLIGDHHLSVVGVVWGLGAAVGLAVYFVVSAHHGEGRLPALVVAWGGLSVGAVAMVVAGAAGVVRLRAPHTSVVLAHTRVSWLVPLLGIGLLAAAFAYVAGIAAARVLGARLASFVGLAEVLFAIVYAWLLLGQKLTDTQLGGGALVVIGIALVRTGESVPAAENGTSTEPVIPQAVVTSPTQTQLEHLA